MILKRFKRTQQSELITGLREIEADATRGLMAADAEARRVALESILIEVKRLIAANK